MKVVQINAVYRLSSTGRNVMELHNYLVDCKHESYKFYSVRNFDSDDYDIVGNNIDHKLHGMCSRVFGKQAYFSFLPTIKLIRKLDKIQPDIVALHNFHSNYVHFPILAKYLAKKDIATVVVLHDCWFFTGHCCHYTEVGCYKWQTECNHCPLIHTNNKSLFFDNSRNIFRDKKRLFGAIPRLAIVGVSDWITNEARKAPIFENAKIFQRIYNWIDLKTFYPRDTKTLREKLGLKETDFVALGVSMNWDYKKGMEKYFEVANAIPDIKIIMIGNMPQDDIPANIINVPPTSSVIELTEYYSLANVLFNFSLQETFGKVAAEALACGTPLIVNNATANPELPGDCGYIIENNNTDQIVKAVKTIRRLGKDEYKDKCVTRANTLFEKEKNLKEYVCLFETLTKNINK
ncbi:MAG: glycosyltransferase [Lachnospiraceae bacterium]|nr:glycosyltransferase [Lachnospiraceae bacterium]